MPEQDNWKEELRNATKKTFVNGGIMSIDDVPPHNWHIDISTLETFIETKILNKYIPVKVSELLKAGEYDQGDVAMINYDDLYDFLSSQAHALKERMKLEIKKQKEYRLSNGKEVAQSGFIGREQTLSAIESMEI